jgi:hypothetical protein
MGIFPDNLDLKNRPYIWNRYLQSIGSNGHWNIDSPPMKSAENGPMHGLHGLRKALQTHGASSGVVSSAGGNPRFKMV